MHIIIICKHICVCVFYSFTGTVCIPLNHLCNDNGRGHLKVPAAHWRQAKKHGIDSNVGEMSSTSFSNAVTGVTIAMASTSTCNENSINCNEDSLKTCLGKNANSASWRQSSQKDEWNNDLHHHRSLTTDVTTPRNTVTQQIWI